MALREGRGVAGPFRGYKTHLYEGGIRSSRCLGPGILKKSGYVNKQSVFSAIDVVPSLLDLSGFKCLRVFHLMEKRCLMF